MPLPEKRRFTLSEIAEQFALAEQSACSIEDVLRFGAEEGLQICSNRRARTIKQPRGKASYQPHVVPPEYLALIRIKGETYIDNPFGLNPREADKLTVEDLFVLREERDRFMREHGIKSPAEANRADNLDKIRLLKAMPEEVCLEFVQNGLMQVKVRDVVVRVPLGELNLIDRRRGGLNSQGAILEHLTKVQIVVRGEDNRKRISRLREVFKTYLGITAEPFDCSQSGWSPRFKVIDSRHAQDERAKRSAKHVPLDESIHADEYPFEDEDDDAGREIRRLKICRLMSEKRKSVSK